MLIDSSQVLHPNPKCRLPRMTWIAGIRWCSMNMRRAMNMHTYIGWCSEANMPKSPSCAETLECTIFSSSFKNKNDKWAPSGEMIPRNAKEQAKMSGSIIWTEKWWETEFRKRMNNVQKWYLREKCRLNSGTRLLSAKKGAEGKAQIADLHSFAPEQVEKIHLQCAGSSVKTNMNADGHYWNK